jgi:hypothetical protein
MHTSEALIVPRPQKSARSNQPDPPQPPQPVGLGISPHEVVYRRVARELTISSVNYNRSEAIMRAVPHPHSDARSHDFLEIRRE